MIVLYIVQVGSTCVNVPTVKYKTNLITLVWLSITLGIMQENVKLFDCRIIIKEIRKIKEKEKKKKKREENEIVLTVSLNVCQV